MLTTEFVYHLASHIIMTTNKMFQNRALHMTLGHHYLHTMLVFEHISNKMLFTTSYFSMLPWYMRLTAVFLNRSKPFKESSKSYNEITAVNIMCPMKILLQ